MLKKSNILALVGGGQLPKFSENKIVIYDEHQRIILSQIRLNSNILKVRIREDIIIGIIIDKIYIFNINTLETIDILDTLVNPHCIFTMSYNNINTELCLAFPNANHKGDVQIENYLFSKERKEKDKSKIINAHDSNIAYIVMNHEGTLLATASDKGTLIRLFNIATKEKITELRRGKKNVQINSLAFDLKNEYLGCTSNVGTVHIFDIHEVNKILEQNEDKDENNATDDKNKKDKVKFGKSFCLIKILDTSFAKFKIKEEKSILGFCPNNCIAVLTEDGKFYKASYKKNESVCTKLEESIININY